MLGKFVRVRITNPVGSLNRQYGYRYSLNFGSLEGRRQFDNRFAGAYIMGIHHPVRHFDGRAIAVLYREGRAQGHTCRCAENMRFIGYQIADALAFAEPEGTYRLECLYERSCGAVVCRRINGEIRLLLIKNSRSAHWGFPKVTWSAAKRPSRLHDARFLKRPGYTSTSSRTSPQNPTTRFRGKVEKSVTIFLAKTEDTETIIQREEIDDYIWLGFDKALETLKFENDKAILKSARRFMDKHGIFETDD